MAGEHRVERKTGPSTATFRYWLAWHLLHLSTWIDSGPFQNLR